MFEIWGTLKLNDSTKNLRISKYFTRVLNDESEALIVPPAYVLWQKEIEKCANAILSFRYFHYEKGPYVTKEFLEKSLSEFYTVKEKILVSLTPMCIDYNLKNGNSIPLTLNQAMLKQHIKSSELFFDSDIGSSYFTYNKENPHLVWVEDTKSLSYKHNLIKSMGFKGIYWENPYGLLEGNWESLYGIWQKRTSC